METRGSAAQRSASGGLRTGSIPGLLSWRSGSETLSAACRVRCCRSPTPGRRDDHGHCGWPEARRAWFLSRFGRIACSARLRCQATPSRFREVVQPHRHRVPRIRPFSTPIRGALRDSASARRDTKAVTRTRFTAQGGGTKRTRSRSTRRIKSSVCFSGRRSHWHGRTRRHIRQGSSCVMRAPRERVAKESDARGATPAGVGQVRGSLGLKEDGR